MMPDSNQFSPHITTPTVSSQLTKQTYQAEPPEKLVAIFLNQFTEQNWAEMLLIYERCEGNITSGTLHTEMARFLSKVSVKQYRAAVEAR